MSFLPDSDELWWLSSLCASGREAGHDYILSASEESSSQSPWHFLLVARESTALVNSCCRAHVTSRTVTFLDADALKMSACIDADARIGVDATVPALTRMHVLTQTPIHTHVDSFLRLLLRAVSSSRLSSMRRFAAPTIWGFEIHFAASDPLLLIWGSQLASLLHRPSSGPGCPLRASSRNRTNYLLTIRTSFLFIQRAQGSHTKIL
ncbi:hypothetical protein CY34DRAFT_610558 [Suillus luteus UH-Slu-Lm8-n1]|uniref:Uncharacterized protein n=1 Tax=Suillus luteus UH-Slu-Lm8-n1 TaxID=930992 RepID=A0A0D0B3U8_9AGAM|nr:hypothetical protein CY34DRAFT_610558 [Suillus luteus UH-Slu-Lm8-n1]